MDKKFKKLVSSIRKRDNEVKNLNNPFIEKYGKPILVHSTPGNEIFKKIISDGMIKVPKIGRDIEHLSVERLIGMYPSIFFSLGFQYACSYDFKYSLIFNINLLKKDRRIHAN